MEELKDYVTKDRELKDIVKRSQELKLKEKELERSREVFEKEKAEASSLKRMVEECSRELKSKRNQFFTTVDSLTMCQREVEIKENQLGQVTDELRRRCCEAREVEERTRVIEGDMFRKKREMGLILDRMEDVTLRKKEEIGLVLSQLEGRSCRKKKELGLVLDQLEGKKKELGLVVDQIKECGKRLKTVDEQLESRQRLLSSELDSKEKELECVRESVNVAEAGASCLYARCQRFRKEVDDKEKELDLLKNQIESEEKKLIQLKIDMGEEKERKKKELELILDQVKESSKQFVAVEEKLEIRQRLLTIQSSELDSKENELERVKESIKHSKTDLEQKEKKMLSLNNITVCVDSKSKELEKLQKLIEQQTSVLGVMNNQLDLLKHQIESNEKKRIQLQKEMEGTTDRKKKNLELILYKIKEYGKQLAAVDEQLESQRRLLEIQSRELASKENELECVGKSSKRFKRDLEVKEKRVQELSNLMKNSDEQLDLKSKELGEIQKLIEEQRKKLHNSQQNAAETEPLYEDAPLHHESSPYLVRDEVSRKLKASPNPVELVLDLVQKFIRDESGLEDSSMEIMVLFFDELAKLRLPNEPQLQLKAREVAILWKGKITIEAPKSSLEALAFLMFIVAYELKELINQEESTLLASSIAHYEQAPTLFKSLGLTLMVPEFVKELINKRQYIPAVRFMCLFKLNRESSLSPSELLKEEIIKLRESALGKRQNESSEAKDKDAGRLRAILELVADYNLQVDLPGDLVVKLIVQREKSTPLVRCSVIQLPSLSNQQATNSPDPVSGQRSSVNLLRVPKPEFKNLKRPRF